MHTMAVIILVYLFRFAMAVNWIEDPLATQNDDDASLKQFITAWICEK